MIDITCHQCKTKISYKEYSGFLQGEVFSGVFCPHCGAGQPVTYTKVGSPAKRSVATFKRASRSGDVRKREVFMSCPHCNTWFEWKEESLCPFCHTKVEVEGVEHRTIPKAKDTNKAMIIWLNIQNKQAEVVELMHKMMDTTNQKMEEQIKIKLNQIAKLQSLLRG